jgi:hypothetical protein
MKTKSAAAITHFKACMAAGKYPMTYNHDPLRLKYIGITIDIDKLAHKLSISMPGYVAKMRARYPGRGLLPVTTPMPYQEPLYGAKIQAPHPKDSSPLLDPLAVKEHQSIIGAGLYFARICDLEILTAVGDLGSEQAEHRSSLTAKVDQFLSYLFANEDASITYHASDMILNAYSDGSYLSVIRARSRAGGCAFFGWEDSSRLNGMIYAKSTILDVVVSSAAECEYGSLYLLARDMVWLREISRAVGYPQKATRLNTNNRCANGLANGIAKLSKSKAMDMRFHWLRDRVQQGHFEVSWIAGEQNIADFFTKALPASTHIRLVRRITGRTPFCGARAAAKFAKSTKSPFASAV